MYIYIYIYISLALLSVGKSVVPKFWRNFCKSSLNIEGLVSLVKD